MSPTEKSLEVILEHCRMLGLPEKGVAYVREVITSPPSRKVQNRRGNVTVRFASRKMRMTIQCESHTVELVFVIIQEHRQLTHWFYDQPLALKLQYTRPDGRVVTILYTPDFLTIEDDRVVLTECKPREAYGELVQKNPGRYVLDAAGELQCPAAEAAAAELGVAFRIWSPSEKDKVLATNLKFLSDYFREDSPPAPEEAARRIKAAVMKEQHISIEALKADPEAVNIDHVYALVAQGHIFFDLQGSLISDHRTAILYPNEEMAKAHGFVRQGLDTSRDLLKTLPVHVGAQVTWGGTVYSIANLGLDNVQLACGQDRVPLDRSLFEQLAKTGEIAGVGQQIDAAIPPQMLEILLSTSEQEFAVANDRWYCYQNPNSPKALQIPRSSWRRLRRRCRIALEALGCAYLGCLPRYHDRGNHNDRLPAAVYEVADRLVKEHYLNLKQKNKRAIYGLIKQECDQRGLVAPSYQWTVDRINQLDPHVVALARKGRRAAYRFTPQFHGQLNPNHGDRPLALVLIDHTQFDIFLVSEDTGEVLGKPWLTLAIDAYSRRVVAFAITFDAPSHRILMLIVRRIVQRYGRMPSFLSAIRDRLQAGGSAIQPHETAKNVVALFPGNSAEPVQPEQGPAASEQDEQTYGDF